MPISSTKENPWEMIKYKPVLQSHAGLMMKDSEYKINRVHMSLGNSTCNQLSILYWLILWTYTPVVEQS